MLHDEEDIGEDGTSIKSQKNATQLKDSKGTMLTNLPIDNL
jgi:hypothetical protein